MGYSARRGFNSGSMKATGAQRQAEVQQKITQMQEAMNTAQEEVEAKTFTSSAGGGVVTAVASGKKELVSITIKPEAVDPEDVEMLQDLVVSAANEALRQAGEAMDQAMDNVTGGLASNLNLGGITI
ncbi:MAG: YbaB/EbfC family nucleoid-associated protein [Oscillibacter sp.]|jgi:DNA-binding YbaB/EbfC family protein|nr:YbaB/EbfC family nucleoid-associated protein [Oscillibacter sp.]